MPGNDIVRSRGGALLCKGVRRDPAARPAAPHKARLRSLRLSAHTCNTCSERFVSEYICTQRFAIRTALCQQS